MEPVHEEPTHAWGPKSEKGIVYIKCLFGNECFKPQKVTEDHNDLF